LSQRVSWQLARARDKVTLRGADEEVRKRRTRSGGSKKVSFIEGWVEYLSKSDAKKAALAFHNQPVNPKLKGFHGADLWAIKYLPKFRWHHLQEKLQYEQRLRAARLRTGLGEARRENEEYLRRVDLAAKISATERRKREREGSDAEEDIRAKRATHSGGPRGLSPLKRRVGVSE
jgi:ESF2/ABP1 family protein